MGKHSNALKDAAKAGQVDAFKSLRESVDVGRLGLAMQAVKQRVEQDLMIAIAAYEIDENTENKNHRIHRDPTDGISEILMIKDRLDTVNKLLDEYQAQFLVEHPELLEAHVEEGSDDTEGEVDPDAGWEEVAESDPASAEE